MTMESLTGIHAYRGANEGLEGSWVVRSGGQKSGDRHDGGLRVSKY